MRVVAEEEAGIADVIAVCRSRHGSVLRNQHILKCDHFPSCVETRIPQISAAPNLRQGQGSRATFGCGQPLQAGIGEVAQRIRDASGHPNILWVNCRQEPMIYINNRPYCVKRRATPFANLLGLEGITAVQLENLEQDLKQQILDEAAQNDGRVLLHGERPATSSEIAAWGEVYAYWEPVTPDSVRTAAEAFQSHGAVIPRGSSNQQHEYDRPQLVYHRIPITDEHSPAERDFDLIMSALRDAGSSSAVVFNCQLGRGRATTGMVIATMIERARIGGLDGNSSDGSSPSSSPSTSPSPSPPPPAGEEENVLQHFSQPARDLTHFSIKACDQLQNLQDAIAYKQARAAKHRVHGEDLVSDIYDQAVAAAKSSSTASHKGAAEDTSKTLRAISKLCSKEKGETTVALQYLERYVYLLLFGEFLSEAASAAAETDAMAPNASFVAWMRNHQDYYMLLDSLSN